MSAKEVTPTARGCYVNGVHYKENDKTPRCFVCNHVFPSRQALRAHSDSYHHNDVFHFKCGVCAKTYAHLPTLISHLASHVKNSSPRSSGTSKMHLEPASSDASSDEALTDDDDADDCASLGGGPVYEVGELPVSLRGDKRQIVLYD